MPEHIPFKNVWHQSRELPCGTSSVLLLSLPSVWTVHTLNIDFKCQMLSDIFLKVAFQYFGGTRDSMSKLHDELKKGAWTAEVGVQLL